MKTQDFTPHELPCVPLAHKAVLLLPQVLLAPCKCHLPMVAGINSIQLVFQVKTVEKAQFSSLKPLRNHLL